MKRIPKIGTAYLQQTKALNSRVITLLHSMVETFRDLGDKEDHRNARDITRVIKKLAREQVEVKQEIRGQRTSQRVSKKHPPVRAQARGGIVVPASANVTHIKVGANLPVPVQSAA